MTEIGPHLLGRTVEHPEANRAFAYPKRTVARPVSVTWATKAPILNQGKIGACEGYTAIEWLNCDVATRNRASSTFRPKMAAGRLLTGADAVAAYSRATELDDDGVATRYPPDDGGTSAVGIAKAMKSYGAIDKYEWTFDWEHFTAAMAHQPVMLGTNWYSGMFDPDRKGVVEATGELQGGHAYLARGIDYQNQRVLCRNHWGARWGVKGEFWLGFATLQRLLKEDGDVLVPGLLA
jgi:hypothetical protein